ncbi:MAG: MarR family transcriptional regulator [Candidatus Heimdallarchaeaceae archaeon]
MRRVKLTREQIRKIRRLYNTDDFTQIEISRMYNVSQGTISRIINFDRSYKNV